MTVSATVLIARLCHEATRAICACFDQPALPSWNDAREWQRASAIDGVEFHLANPNAGPSASHDNWAAMRRSQGWVYGATKDEQAKTHPCLVPFEELPPEQRVKDHVFGALVHGAAAYFETGVALVGTLDIFAGPNVIGTINSSDPAVAAATAAAIKGADTGNSIGQDTQGVNGPLYDLLERRFAALQLAVSAKAHLEPTADTVGRAQEFVAFLSKGA